MTETRKYIEEHKDEMTELLAELVGELDRVYECEAASVEVFSAAHESDDHQSQKDAGESQDTVVYSHQYLVQPPSEVAGEESDEDALDGF